MKQHKIANWLKGIVVFLAVLGTLFVIGVTIYAFKSQESHPISSIIGFPLFTWYTITFCYGALFQFWKVCREIAKENSFCPENATAFHKMSLFGIFLGIGFVAKICTILFLGDLNFVYGLFIVFEIVASIVFVVLCMALSKLILHAYEMKQENELTI